MSAAIAEPAERAKARAMREVAVRFMMSSFSLVVGERATAECSNFDRFDRFDLRYLSFVDGFNI